MSRQTLPTTVVARHRGAVQGHEQGRCAAGDTGTRSPAREPDQRLQCLRRRRRTCRQKAGETDERLWALAAWRESPYFSDAERAALALTEAATRLSDRTDAVPDQIWADATDHYDEQGLAALIKEPAGATWS